MNIASHPEFLTNNPLLRTADLDEARCSVAQKFCDHRLVKTSRCDVLNVRHNHVAGPQMSINYLHYGADVEIDPGMLVDFYLLQIPLSGSAFVRHRGTEIMACPQTATLLNPDRETQMQWRGDCHKLLLQIDREYLDSVAADLLGAPAPGVIRFDPVVDFKCPKTIHLRSLVVKTAHLAGEAALFSGASNAQDHFAQETLVSTLLTHQTSNISHMLDRVDRGAMPAAVRRALQYIHGNLSEPIALSDMARSAGVNVRTLQKAFQQATGQTPMQALRDARLNAAHYLLTKRQNPPSVMDAAFSVGFSHLGRFSRDYKIRFGQSPSRRL